MNGRCLQSDGLCSRARVGRTTWRRENEGNRNWHFPRLGPASKAASREEKERDEVYRRAAFDLENINPQ